MTPFLTHKNRTVRVDHTAITENALAKTYLSADMAASSGTLTVQDIAKFAVGKFVWINPFSEKSEIIAVHASTAPSGSTITLASNTAFAHSAGEEVLYVEFNQVEVSHASTLTGSKSVLATVGLDAGAKFTAYLDTTQTTGFYFGRFKDSVASTFGSYADGIAYGGYDENSVGYMIDRALRDNGVDLSEKLTVEDCYEFLNDGLNEIQTKQIRFPEHQSLNYVLGQTSRGSRTFTLPSDIYDDDTLKSIMGVRVGEGPNLRALDPEEFEQLLEDTVETDVRTEASANDTTLEIDNSYDFADSGTVHVYISGTRYDITYTGVTRSATTGVLTGVPSSGTGSITVTIPVDTKVWQDEDDGEPAFYTVRGGNLEIGPMPDAKWDNKNVYLDYTKVVTRVDSDGDTIDYQRYQSLQSYLTWRMRMRTKNDNKLDLSDGWHVKYKEQLNDMIRTKRSTMTHKTAPRINRIAYRGTWPNYKRSRDND